MHLIVANGQEATSRTGQCMRHYETSICHKNNESNLGGNQLYCRQMPSETSPFVSANPCHFYVSQFQAPYSDARLMTHACSGSRADMNWVTLVLMKFFA